MSTDHARQHALGDIPRRTAARFPDKTALIDGDTTISFAQFDAIINRIANALVERGHNKGDRVALLSRNRWEYAALSFATARIGVVLVPINFMLNANEITFILDHSDARTILVEETLSDVADLAVAASHRPDIHRVALDDMTDTGWESFSHWLTSPPTPPPHVSVDDDDPVRLMYTSGTESRPKGVQLSSRALMWQYVSCVVDGGMTRGDVDLHALPMYHCAQMDCFLGPDIYLGATSIITAGPETERVLQLIAQHKVTKFFAPPTVWIAILRSPAFESTDLSSLNKGYYGASAMPIEILRELAERLPNVRLWNFYGQTEMSPVATILQPDEQLAHPGAAGRPTLNVETLVVDDNNRSVPTGVIGEIVHRSPHLTLGYHNDPAKTDEAFTDGWFHSGDLGIFDEFGLLHVVDRKKDMIKTGGENVASREVEEAIYLHPSVAEVAVFGVPDAKWIEAVAAVVVPRGDARLTAQSLIDHCRQHLAGYKLPKHVTIADSLPKNPSGKILKRSLRDGYAQRVQPTENSSPPMNHIDNTPRQPQTSDS